MKTKIILLTFTTAALVALSGCSTICGVNRETTQRRELIKSGVQDTQKRSRVDVDYEFKKIKGEDWLAVQAKEVSYEQTRTEDVYEVQNVTHREFKDKNTVMINVAGIVLGGYLYLQGTKDNSDEANPFQPTDTSKNKNYKTAGLITAGVFAVGLLVDGINALRFQTDSVETVREEKVPVGNIENNTVASEALKNVECTLRVAGSGEKKFRLDENGSGSVKVSDLPDFRNSLSNLVWGAISISGDGTTHEIKLNKALEAENEKRQQEVADNNLRRYKQTVSKMMKDGRWNEALMTLKEYKLRYGSYDGMDSQVAKIKENIKIGDVETAKLILGVNAGSRGDMSDYVMKLLDPVANKNKPVVFNATMFQDLGGTTRLVKVGDSTIIRVVKAENTKTQFDFVTGHPVMIYGVILGTYTYATVEGGTNTVTKVKCYWMQSLFKN
jgi:hypothetical protein